MTESRKKKKYDRPRERYSIKINNKKEMRPFEMAVEPSKLAVKKE